RGDGQDLEGDVVGGGQVDGPAERRLGGPGEVGGGEDASGREGAVASDDEDGLAALADEAQGRGADGALAVTAASDGADGDEGGVVVVGGVLEHARGASLADVEDEGDAGGVEAVDDASHVLLDLLEGDGLELEGGGIATESGDDAAGLGGVGQ